MKQTWISNIIQPALWDVPLCEPVPNTRDVHRGRQAVIDIENAPKGTCVWTLGSSGCCHFGVVVESLESGTNCSKPTNWSGEILLRVPACILFHANKLLPGVPATLDGQLPPPCLTQESFRQVAVWWDREVRYLGSLWWEKSLIQMWVLALKNFQFWKGRV